MDIITGVIGRGLLLIFGMWVGVTLVAGTALLVESYRRFRRGRPKSEWITAECPNCGGRGVTRNTYGEYDICPLCDGESSLIQRRSLNP